MKKFLLILTGIVICLAIAIGWVILNSFDAESVKNQFVTSLKEVTGREVKVKEDAVLTWSPVPTLTLKNVSLANIGGSEVPDMLTIPEVQIQIEWGSLFANPIRISRVILKRPNLLVERLSDDVINVQFTKLFRQKIELETLNMLGEYQKSTSIDTIEITDGEIKYTNRLAASTDEVHKLSGIIHMDSLNGPMAFSGQGVWHDLKLNIGIKLAELKPAEPLSFSGRISELTSQTTSDFFGKIVTDGSADAGLSDDPNVYMVVDGSVIVKRPAVLFNLLKWPEFPENKDVPMDANFKMSIANNYTTWDSVSVRFGQQENDLALNATWKYFIYHKKLEMNLAVTGNMESKKWQTFFDQADLKNKRDKFSVINGEVSIENLIMDLNRIENVHLRGIYQSNNLKVVSLTGVFPGGAMLRADGNMQLDTKKINGNFDLSVDNTKDLLAFLKIPLPEDLNTDILRKGVVVGKLDFSDAEDKINITKFELDQIKGKGTITRDKDQAVHVQLNMNNVDIDQYFLRKTSDQRISLSGELYELEETMTKMEKPDFPIFWNTDVRDMKWHGLQIRSFQGQGQIATSEVSAKIEAKDIATANMSLDFNLINSESDGWFLKSGKLEFSAGSFDTFLQRAGWTTGYDFWDNTQQISADIEMSGRAKEWSAKGTLKRQTLDISFNGQLTDAGLQNMSVNLTHPDFRGVMYALDPKFAAFPKLRGALNFSGQLSGNTQKLQAEDMTLNIGNQKLLGSWYYEPENKIVRAKLTTDEFNLSKFLPDAPSIYHPEAGFSRRNFDLEALNPWSVDLQLNANQVYYKSVDLRKVEIIGELKNRVFVVRNFTSQWGEVEDSSIKMNGQFGWDDNIPTLNAEITVEKVPLRPTTLMLDSIGFTKGLLDLKGKLNFVGLNPAAMVQNSSGQGELSLSNIVWIGADVDSALSIADNAKNHQEKENVYEASLVQALTKGKTMITEAKAEFALEKGKIKIMDGEMSLDPVKVSSVQVNYDIPSKSLSMQMSMFLDATMPPVLYSLNNRLKQDYTVDVKQFIKALGSEILNIKKQEEVKKEQEVQEKNLSLLKLKKEETQESLARFKTRLNDVEAQILLTSDPEAQKNWDQAQNIFVTIAPLVEQNLDTLAAYAQITKQIENGYEFLSQAEGILFAKNLSHYQKKTAMHLKAIEGRIDEISQFYHQKKHLDILSALLEGCKEQQVIVERASVQLQRHLTPEQAQKVYGIITDATEKVERAYQYAYELYTEQKQAPKYGAISVKGQSE